MRLILCLMFVLFLMQNCFADPDAERILKENGIKYDSAESSVGGIIVELNGKKGAYDMTKKNFNVPLIYDDLESEYTHGGFIATLDGKKGAISDNGDIYIPIIYDNVTFIRTGINNDGYFAQGYLLLEKDGKKGAYNLDYYWGQRRSYVIPVEFDELEARYTFWLVKNNGKYGIYHVDKGLIIPCKYDKITFKDERTAILHLNNKQSKKKIPETNFRRGLSMSSAQKTLLLITCPYFAPLIIE